jgi:hypothetical protein
VRAVALPQRLHEFRILNFLMGVQPLLELIENDQQFFPRRNSASAPQERERVSQAQIVRQIRTMSPETDQQTGFGLAGCGFEIHGDHIAGESRQQSRFDQRSLAAARRSVDQAHRKALIGVPLLDARLPEPNTLGQTSAVTWTGQQVEEIIGVVLIE